MKTAILLGAGSSLPAGFSSTQKLTDLVLSGTGIEKNSSGSYQPAGGPAPMKTATGLSTRREEKA